LQEYQPNDEVLLALGNPTFAGTGSAGPTYLRGAGCAACRGRGYQGRVAIVERMAMTSELRQLIAENQPADVIRQQALAEGMTTLRQNGLEKVQAGVTTVEEILRVCLSDD